MIISTVDPQFFIVNSNMVVHPLCSIYNFIYSIISSLRLFFFSPRTLNPGLIALHIKTSSYLNFDALVCLNNFSIGKREDRTSYRIQVMKWSWLYTEEKLHLLFCSGCFLCCSYDLQLSLRTFQKANHSNYKCLFKTPIPHLWTHGSVKIVRIMLFCIYYFLFISTKFCLPFYLQPLKITRSVYTFVVSVSFCLLEGLYSTRKLRHLIKHLLFEITSNHDEQYSSHHNSLFVLTTSLHRENSKSTPTLYSPSFHLPFCFSP